MSETEKVWIVGPNGARVCVVIGVEMDRNTFDKRVSAGDFTVLDGPDGDLIEQSSEDVADGEVLEAEEPVAEPEAVDESAPKSPRKASAKDAE